MRLGLRTDTTANPLNFDYHFASDEMLMVAVTYSASDALSSSPSARTPVTIYTW